jgi:tetratricopeptide (TPR) repeat protein
MHFRRLPRFGFWLLVSLCLCLGFAAIQLPRTIASEAPSLTQQGIDQYQAGQFQPAIALWQQALAQTTDPQQQAAIHNNLALARRQTGELSAAIDHWQQAIALHRLGNAAQEQISKLQIEQAQAYSRLGQHQRAIDLAQSTVQQTQQDPLVQAAAFGSLGNACGRRGTPIWLWKPSSKVSTWRGSFRTRSTSLQR